MKWPKPKKETHEANLKSRFYYTRGDERSVMVNEQATNDRMNFADNVRKMCGQ